MSMEHIIFSASTINVKYRNKYNNHKAGTYLRINKHTQQSESIVVNY